MEKMVDALEKHAGMLSAELSTEAAMLQELGNRTLNHSEESIEYKLGVDELQKYLSEFNSDYIEAESVIAVSDRLELGKADEEREEEVRFAKEKYFSSNLTNPYNGKIGEAVAAHQDRQLEARKKEILAHGTPVQSLRNTLDQYKEVLSELEDAFEQIETGVEYEEREHDAEIIDETEEPVEIQDNWRKGALWETV